MAAGKAQVFADLNTQLLAPISSYIDTAVSNVQSAIDAPLKAGIVLYIMWFGWQLMVGATPIAMAEIVKRALRIGVILMLCLSGGSEGGYSKYVKTPLLTDIPNQVSEMVVKDKFTDSNGAAFDTIVNNAAKSAATMRQASSGWSISAAIGAQVQSLLLELAAYVTAAVGFYYVMYAKIVLGMLLSLGPIFIAMALFDTTRRFFDGWLSQCANFIILQILIATVCSVMMTMLTTVLGGTFGPEQPGALAAALVTCLVMVMIFFQLPVISHALAQGGASLGMSSVAGFTSVRNLVSNRAGDAVASAGNSAREARAGTGPFKAAGPNKTWGNYVLSRGPTDARGPFRDHRNYNGRSRSSSNGSSATGDNGAPGGNTYDEQNSERKP